MNRTKRLFTLLFSVIFVLILFLPVIPSASAAEETEIPEAEEILDAETVPEAQKASEEAATGEAQQSPDEEELVEVSGSVSDLIDAGQELNSTISSLLENGLDLGSVTVPILLYHNLTPEKTSGSSITVDNFRHQMDLLEEYGFNPVSFEDLISFVNKGVALPENPVVITFDDGYYSNYEYAYPILREKNFKATIFAIGSSVGHMTNYKNTSYPITPHFGESEIREMVASGLISVQSHTYDMHQNANYETGNSRIRENMLPLSGETEQQYSDAVREDTEKMRTLLEGCGEELFALAYPKGRYTAVTEKVLKEEGIKVIVTIDQTHKNTVTFGKPESLYALGRYTMYDSTTDADLLCYLNGGDAYSAAPEAPYVSSGKNGMLALTCDTPDVTIYYTTDGSEPSLYSAEYHTPFMAGTVTKAIAVSAMKRSSKTITVYKTEYGDFFYDVPGDQWYYPYIGEAFHKGWMSGTADYVFDPDGIMNRAMLVTVLYSMEGKPSVSTSGTFTDVSSGRWYTKAVEWAAANDIVSGTGNGKFEPEATLTREQMATILKKYAGYCGADTEERASLDGFADAGKISNYAVESIKWCVSAGLLSGKSATTLDPRGSCTRAECATMLTKLNKVLSSSSSGNPLTDLVKKVVPSDSSSTNLAERLGLKSAS